MGWAISKRIDGELAIHALKMAIGKRLLAPGCIHHSDRGVRSHALGCSSPPVITIALSCLSKLYFLFVDKRFKIFTHGTVIDEVDTNRDI